MYSHSTWLYTILQENLMWANRVFCCNLSGESSQANSSLLLEVCDCIKVCLLLFLHWKFPSKTISRTCHRGNIVYCGYVQVVAIVYWEYTWVRLQAFWLAICIGWRLSDYQSNPAILCYLYTSNLHLVFDFMTMALTPINQCFISLSSCICISDSEAGW